LSSDAVTESKILRAERDIATPGGMCVVVSLFFNSLHARCSSTLLRVLKTELSIELKKLLSAVKPLCFTNGIPA